MKKRKGKDECRRPRVKVKKGGRERKKGDSRTDRRRGKERKKGGEEEGRRGKGKSECEKGRVG